MSESISYRGSYGLLVRQTQARVYVILQEHTVHIRRLPVSDMEYITFLPKCPVGKMKRSLRQFAKNKLSRDCREALK